jgi:hypothetical protein
MATPKDWSDFFLNDLALQSLLNQGSTPNLNQTEQSSMEDWKIAEIIGFKPWTDSTRVGDITYEHSPFIRSWLIAKDMPLAKVQSLSHEQLAKCYCIKNYFLTVKGDRPKGYKAKPVSIDFETEVDGLLESDPITETLEKYKWWTSTSPQTSSPPVQTLNPAAIKPLTLTELLAIPGLQDFIETKAETKAHKTAYEIAHEETGRIAASVAKAEIEKRVKIVEKVTVLTHLGSYSYQTDQVHPEFETLLKALACKLNVMLVGTASSGKTTAGSMAAKVLGLDFRHMGAVTTEYKFSGYEDGNGRYHSTPFRQVFERGGVILLDEYDASVPGATMFIQAALANGTCSFPDSIIEAHPDFRCIAACNTYGRGADRIFVGRNQQDGAAMDRFVVLNWDIDESLESSLFGDGISMPNPYTAPRPHMAEGISTIPGDGTHTPLYAYYANFYKHVSAGHKVYACKAIKDATGCDLQTALRIVTDFLTGDSQISKLDFNQFRDLCDTIVEPDHHIPPAQAGSQSTEGEVVSPALSPGDWVRYVQKIRKSVTELGERHLVTMRASDYGNRLLGAGLPLSKVEAMCIWKGLPESIVNKIKHHAGV